MSIPELRFDNPLDIDQLPDEPLVTKLPALGRPQPLGHVYSWANAKVCLLMAMVFVQSFLTFFAGYAGGTTWVSEWLASATVRRGDCSTTAMSRIRFISGRDDGGAPTLATNVSMAVHRSSQW